MPRARVTITLIHDVGLRIADRDGFEALTLSNVAAALEVRPSALYTHVDGLDGLHHQIAIAATHHLTTRVRDAAVGNAGADAIAAMGVAYRRFLHDHPGQFASTLRPPSGNDRDDLADATQALLDVFALVFRAMGMDDDSSTLAARSTRSAIHGFLALEHTSGTNPTHEAEYDHLLATLRRGLG